MTALFWGAIASSSLVLGGLLAIRLSIPQRIVGLIMAFGVGVLFSAVAYELVEEAFEMSPIAVAVGMLAGALTFFVGDALIDRMGGHNRKRTTDRPANASATAITLGTVLDGIPESMVLGLTLVGGQGIGIAVLAAVFLSNLPEAIAATVGMRANGWKSSRILGLWFGVTAISALAALAGYTLLDDASPTIVALANAFAGGAILTMLADTMAPEAYESGGRAAGLVTTLGFLTAFFLAGLE